MVTSLSYYKSLKYEIWFLCKTHSSNKLYTQNIVLLEYYSNWMANQIEPNIIKKSSLQYVTSELKQKIT